MRRDDATETMIRKKFEALRPHLDERARRLWAATEARVIGYGGITAVSRATGMSRNTVAAGLAELDAEEVLEPGRIRHPGGGRPSATDAQPGLEAALDELIEPVTRGDPESPLRWTTKSKEKLAKELRGKGLRISGTTVRRLLLKKGYRLQSVKKSLERRHHDDRDAQFIYINGAVNDFQADGNPAISVDTKKKELIGDFSVSGREWHPSGQPPLALSHDFPTDALGKAIPYGVYDLERNDALVNIGVDRDTSAFAVESIRRWWFTVGQQAYPNADQLLITADAGGSNGYRRRAWKRGLQHLANEIGFPVHVVHFPPGTSKWNKIEHRLFCQISRNWRGRPLRDYQTVVQLIGKTTTKTGLRVTAMLDHGEYPKGVRVSDEEMKALNITPSPWHGEWNYTISVSLG